MDETTVRLAADALAHDSLPNDVQNCDALAGPLASWDTELPDVHRCHNESKSVPNHSALDSCVGLSSSWLAFSFALLLEVHFCQVSFAIIDLIIP